MAVDILQDIIRKQKNPFVLELALPLSKLPDGFSRDGQGYGAFCLELIRGLKGQVGALRVSFHPAARLFCLRNVSVNYSFSATASVTCELLLRILKALPCARGMILFAVLPGVTKHCDT